MNRAIRLFFLVFAASAGTSVADPFVRPDGKSSPPVWGNRDGLQIGLWPTSGPRGLIRIYTPYLNQPAGRVMQFIAVEPVVSGARDLSEMQQSSLDHKQGKQMWTADEVDLAHPPAATTEPARGHIARNGEVQTLSFFIIAEPFDNGARPIIKVTFSSDRPHEVQLQTLAADQSQAMDSCILSATMGNYARLRHLQLKDRQIDAVSLYSGRSADTWDFYPHQYFKDLPLENGMAIFAATGDGDPKSAADVGNWGYVGNQGRQYWKTKPVADLVAVVNARNTFWGTHTAIPGGRAFENFELNSPYEPGQSFYFGIEPVEERK